MLRFMTTDDGYFIDPETGEKIPVEEMMKGDNNADKDKSAGSKKPSTDKKAHLGQVKT